MRSTSAPAWMAAIIAIVVSLLFAGDTKAQKGEPPIKSLDTAPCYDCHETVRDLHKSGKHAKITCSNCHGNLEKHLSNPGPDTRPPTDTSWEACGKCHKEQYITSLKVAHHRPARDEKSQLTNRSPNPLWDKLMMGHGFTKEHALTRSHPWMLIDHLLVDRAYGGRFQPRDGWAYTIANPSNTTWDILVDVYPDAKEHKPFIPQSAAGANPTCFQCKSQDHILDWAYMGDPVSGARWSRTSKSFELAKSLKHSLNCYTCHDPHSAQPRIVRECLDRSPDTEGRRYPLA